MIILGAIFEQGGVTGLSYNDQGDQVEAEESLIDRNWGAEI